MSEAQKKIVILGGKGMLGSDLSLECQKQKLQSVVFDLPEFDITNESHLAAAIQDAEIIINCAAYTDVEKAESEFELACKVNGEAVGKLGKIAKDNDIWVLHISTDFVFDGDKAEPYVETDAPNPINAYGKSKLMGERLLIESGCKSCIMRVEWTYGKAGNNFVSKLVSVARQGKSLKVIDDQTGSPTATTEVSKAVCEVIRTRPEGIFHFANDGYVSRYKMAKLMFDKLGMTVELASCKTSDYVSAAKRPLNSRFDCSKIKKLLTEQIEPWQMPLERFLRRI